MTFLARISRCHARFIGDRRGVSAVEFAVLLPVMVTLYLGSVEASQGIAADRKVELTAHALADLTSQYTNITNTDMSNILNAGSAIIAPYAAGNLHEVVSEIAIDAQGMATVVWSDTLNGTALTVGQTVDRSGLARRAQQLSDLRAGAVRLRSGLRLRHDRHAEFERSEFYAAAQIGLDLAIGVVIGNCRSAIG